MGEGKGRKEEEERTPKKEVEAAAAAVMKKMGRKVTMAGSRSGWKSAKSVM